MTRPSQLSPIARERSTTLRAKYSPSLSDLHWAAGFIEGEGSFTHQHGGCGIFAHQVESGPIQKLLDMFGGNIYEVNNKNQHRMYRWVAHGARARGIMLTLYPLLFTKRRIQVKCSLECY